MLTHLFLYLSVEPAFTGANDVSACPDACRNLVDRLVEHCPPVPPDAKP